MTTRVAVNKNILEWAIERSGFQLQELSATNSNIEDWLNQKKQPTVKQLEKLAEKLYFPFGYFFLEEPIEEKINFPFFRTGKEATKQVSINVKDAINIIETRQDWMTDYMIDNDFDKLSFVGKFNANTQVTAIVEDIRTTLDLDDLWAENQPNWETALRYLTQQIEEAGIFVSFSSCVGNNNRRKIPVNECRGFVLVNDYAPFIFVNSGDAKSAQMFTLAHELAHIWLGKSAGFDYKNMLPFNNEIEVLCDKVAAEFLVPEVYFNQKWRISQDFINLSKVFKVSPIVIARRALDTGKISKKKFFDFYNSYIERLKNIDKKSGGGGNFYATTRMRVSPRFAGFVKSALQQNKIQHKQAYRLTNLKGTTFNTFFNEHL